MGKLEFFLLRGGGGYLSFARHDDAKVLKTQTHFLCYQEVVGVAAKTSKGGLWKCVALNSI